MAASGGGTSVEAGAVSVGGPLQTSDRDTAGDSDLPFAALSDAWEDIEMLEFQQDARRTQSTAPTMPRDLLGRLRLEGRRARRNLFAVLQLLSCSIMAYFYEHLAPRNIILLGMSAGVQVSAWLLLSPCSLGWSVGLLYVLAGISRVGVVDPVFTAALALVLQAAFEFTSVSWKQALWYGYAVISAISEVCWWPNAQFLIEGDFHAWLVHFSTYYGMVILLWFWPRLLEIDPDKWGVAKAYDRAPPETKKAVTEVGASIVVLVMVPLLACVIISLVVMWRRNRRLCITITVIYLALCVILIVAQNASPSQVATIGQFPIAIILLALAREQLSLVFGDNRTWKAQAMLFFSFLLLRLIALPQLPQNDRLRAEAAAILVLQLLSKQWMSAQCCAIHLGLPDAFRLSAWAPRRACFLLRPNQAEVHEPGLLLER